MHDKLFKIQSELKVPKGQRNSFGNYNYRSCEDIVEAAKPLCEKYGVSLTLSDEVREIGYVNQIRSGELGGSGHSRVFVCATATISDGDKHISTQGYAEVAPEKKGMDSAQITGAASSYARKYALNGLFAIDDTKDPDATNNHGKKGKKDYPAAPQLSDDLDL